MAKTLKKVMAVLLAGLVTATAPVNVSAAAASEDGHAYSAGMDSAQAVRCSLTRA